MDTKMGPKMIHIVAILWTFFFIEASMAMHAHHVPAHFLDDTIPIPEDKAQVETWFSNIIRPAGERKAILDPALVVAEEGVRVIRVMQDGRGHFRTITQAVNSIPVGNTKRVIVWIGGGHYREKVKIEKTKPFVTLYGSPKNMPNISFDGTALQYGTVDSATLIAESDYFQAVNIVIDNCAPRPDGKRKGAQAVALRISGDKAAFYNCKIHGFQDTLCDDRGTHLFKDCFIQGSVDFIFGSGTSIYLSTELNVIEGYGFTVITAQARETDSDTSGYSFVHSRVTGYSNGTYLGRAWKSHPRVIYAYTDMGNVVKPSGWSNSFRPEVEKTVLFGEYKCSGPGADPDVREKFSKHLTEAQVRPFISLGFIHGSKWLLPPYSPER